MTDHSVYEEQICALLDGELSAEEEASLRAHLDGCDECRAFLSAMEAVYGVTAKGLPEAPSGLARNVMDRVRAGAVPAEKKARILRFPYRSLAAAAAAALVLWAGARSLPMFRAKNADSAAPAAGAAQSFSISSSAEQSVLEEAAEAETYGTVNGVPFAEAEAADEAAVPAAPMEPAAFDSAAKTEESRDAGTASTVTLRGTEILVEGEPVTFEELTEFLSDPDSRPAGVVLVCDGASGEIEAAVRDLLSQLEIPLL